MRRRLGIAAALAFLLAAGSAEAAPGTLAVKGSFSYVEIRANDGRLVAQRRPARRPVRMTRKLAVGRYRVIAEPRGGRTTRCARPVRILSGGLTEIAVKRHGRRGCRLTGRALPALFPPRERVRAVQRYLAGRGATNSWALIDSWGRLRSFAPHRVYVSASLVKAMLLVAYLRKIGDRAPDAGERASLGPMITSSSNEAADTIYYRLGDAAIYDVARRAGMTRFWVGGYWGNGRFSAEDQARFFHKIDRLVPKASRAYARGLLSSIVAYQRWGFSRHSLAHGFKTFFKGGWRSTASGQLVHEAALFERGDTRVSMAVLTDGNPSHEHGTETLREVARRIFAPARRRVARSARPTGGAAGPRGWRVPGASAEPPPPRS